MADQVQGVPDPPPPPPFSPCASRRTGPTTATAARSCCPSGTGPCCKTIRTASSTFKLVLL